MGELSPGELRVPCIFREGQTDRVQQKLPGEHAAPCGQASCWAPPHSSLDDPAQHYGDRTAVMRA